MRKLAGRFMALGVLVLVSASVAAQYPTRPVRIIVPLPAGGPGDTLTRAVAEPLSRALGQPVVVENKPGADGTIGTTEVARAAPDGYVLLMGSANALSAVTVLRKSPPYDPIADFTPISHVGNSTFVLAAGPNVPGTTLMDLINFARANPGKVNFAAPNPTALLVAAQIRALAKIDMVNVPYKGDVAAIPDLLAGRVQLLVAGANVVRPHIKDGKLRILATLLDSRSPLLPDVPTVSEAGLTGLTFSSWNGLVGPAKMPKAVVDRLSREVTIALKRPEVREQLERIGFQPVGTSPEAFGVYMKEQIEVWRRLARDAGIQAE